MNGMKEENKIDYECHPYSGQVHEDPKLLEIFAYPSHSVARHVLPLNVFFSFNTPSSSTSRAYPVFEHIWKFVCTENARQLELALF